MSTCRNCGEVISEGAGGGFCARCVLEGMLAADGGKESDGDVPGLVGSVLGDYEIIEEIAEGGMGLVFKARQRSLDRIVALKTIRGGILAGEKAVRRFQKEARAVAQLDHPNIVPIYEIGRHAGGDFFSMRYIDGDSLAQRIDEYAGDSDRVAELMQKLARTIQFAHDNGVLHRDLKPQNFLIDRAGEPFVTDFGLAKLEADSAQATVTGDFFGSPAFMAPEQADGRHREVDQRTDVYGLGATFYHLLTGKPPFGGTTSLEVFRNVVEEEPPDPRLLKPGLADDLSRICLQCLSKNPGMRYPSAGALADDLERWRKGLPVRARGPSLTYRLTKWFRRNAQRLAGIGVLGAIGLAAPFFNGTESGEEAAVPGPAADQAQVMMPGEKDPPDNDPLFPIAPEQVRDLLSDSFEIPTEAVDAARNPIRRGADPATGLPLEIRERRTGMHFVLVPVPKAAMGDAEWLRLNPWLDLPADKKRLARPYYLGKYETTIGEFGAFVAETRHVTAQQKGAKTMYYPFKGGSKLGRKYAWDALPWEHTARHPVSLVTVADATAMVDWLNQRNVGGFGLPTEMEWEYAARGGPKFPYKWPSFAPDSNRKGNLQDVTNYEAVGRKGHPWGRNRDDGSAFSAAVGAYLPNPFGLYDMVGNVGELCRQPGGTWVCRGGDFESGGEKSMLTARRAASSYNGCAFLFGFRLVWHLPELSTPPAKGDAASTD